jgi:hypothetical protein
MSENTISLDIEVRQFLQNVALSYGNKKYVGDEIFPVISGMSNTAKVHKESRADIYRNEVGVRAAGGAAPRAEVRGGSVNLDPVNYAIAKEVTDELRKRSELQGNFPYMPDAKALMYIADQIMMKREMEVSKLIHTKVWSGLPVGGEDAEGKWGTAVEADDTMMIDLKNAESQMVAAGCPKPNKLTLTFPAWQKICISPYWLNKLNNTQFGLMTPEFLATTLNYKIVIAEAIVNTAEEKSGDIDELTSKYIMSPNVADNLKGHAFLSYSPDVPDTEELSAGYQYRVMNDDDEEIAISSWREPAKHQDVYDGEMMFDIAQMSGECGYLWKDTAID